MKFGNNKISILVNKLNYHSLLKNQNTEIRIENSKFSPSTNATRKITKVNNLKLHESVINTESTTTNQTIIFMTSTE